MHANLQKGVSVVTLDAYSVSLYALACDSVFEMPRQGMPSHLAVVTDELFFLFTAQLEECIAQITELP